MQRLLLILLLLAPLTLANTMPRITLTFGDHSYDVELADTEAAHELLRRLPLTLRMADLNDNEKYGDLPRPLPTQSRSIGSIRTGDLMLFTSTCLVLFYKDFRTIYRYTPVGRVLHPQGLAEALGSGDVQITLEGKLDVGGRR